MPEAIGRVLGIDPGRRWIGLALSDDERRLALPLSTIDRRALDGNDADTIAARIREVLEGDQPALIVAGVPHRPDGAEDEQAAAFRALGERVAAALGLPVAVQDERHSNLTPLTPQSLGGRKPGAVSPARRKRERQQRHAQAAAAILQRWLDAQNAPTLTPQAPLNDSL